MSYSPYWYNPLPSGGLAEAWCDHFGLTMEVQQRLNFYPIFVNNLQSQIAHSLFDHRLRNYVQVVLALQPPKKAVVEPWIDTIVHRFDSYYALEAGDFPREGMLALGEAGRAIFPQINVEKSRCSCGEALPCNHIYGLLRACAHLVENQPIVLLAFCKIPFEHLRERALAAFTDHLTQLEGEPVVVDQARSADDPARASTAFFATSDPVALNLQVVIGASKPIALRRRSRFTIFTRSTLEHCYSTVMAAALAQSRAKDEV